MCARCEISVKKREGKLLSISFSATPMQPSWIWFFDLLRPSQKFALYPVDLECHVHKIRLIASNLQALPSWHISPSHPTEHFCCCWPTRYQKDLVVRLPVWYLVPSLGRAVHSAQNFPLHFQHTIHQYPRLVLLWRLVYEP